MSRFFSSVAVSGSSVFSAGFPSLVLVLSDEVCVVVVIDHVAGPAGPVVTGAA
jgi:hypothetical protein